MAVSYRNSRIPKRVASESPPVAVSRTWRYGSSGDQRRAPGIAIVCRTAFFSPGARVTFSGRPRATRSPPFQVLTAWVRSKLTGAGPRFASHVSTRTEGEATCGATWTLSITGLSASCKDTSS